MTGRPARPARDWPRTPFTYGEPTSTAVADELSELLCDEERARAERLVSERDRRLWTRSRGVLRALLGLYLQRDPSALRFSSGPHGKPALEPAGPSFNLSHSGQLALFAFTERRAVGVDVEVARRPIDELALAARVFGPEEAMRLEGLDRAARRREFLRMWTRHEAALKCRGAGIGESRSGASQLWIAELEVGHDAVGAVALERPAAGLHCWDWP